MKDQVTLVRVAILHPKFVPLITAFIDDVEAFTGNTWRVVQGYRSFSQQAILYARGRTTPGQIVTYSPPGSSYHNYRVAVDAAPIINGVVDWKFDYSKLRDLAKKHNLEMGLDFPHPDSDHFEHKFGLNWRDMYHKVTIKDFMPGTDFINI